MKIVNAVQGSEEWLNIRLIHFTASEAPIMMGTSDVMSRDDLLKYKTTKDQEEVSYFTQKIFDQGHEFEARARPLAEAAIGDELFPVTGAKEIEGLPLLASYDGLTMLSNIVFEHKQLNKQLVEQVQAQDLPPKIYWQLEQQLLVSDADKVVFVVSDGTAENYYSIEYYAVPGRKEELIAGWKQFQADLDGYQPVIYEPKPAAKTIMELPSLSVQLVGEVKHSNLEVYKSTALAFIQSINTELSTDQDFADAEKTVKFCGAAEKELDLVKKQALSQTATIDELFRTVDHLKEELRVKRLELEKLVKSRKEKIKADIVITARAAFGDHINALNDELKDVSLPEIETDFHGAIKGKRTVKTLQEAANDELARLKIYANQLGKTISFNLVTLDELAGDYKSLFPDLQALVIKDPGDFKALVKNRVAEHLQAEAERQVQEQAAESIPVPAASYGGSSYSSQQPAFETPLAPSADVSTVGIDQIDETMEGLYAWKDRFAISDNAFQALLAVLELPADIEAA